MLGATVGRIVALGPPQAQPGPPQAQFDPCYNSFDLWIPLVPPSDNRRRHWTTEAEKEFRDVVSEMASRTGVKKHTGWVIVEIALVWENKRKRDAGNCFKVLMDSLQRAGLIEDDAYALPRVLWVKRVGDPLLEPYQRGGGVGIRITPADPSLVPSP